MSTRSLLLSRTNSSRWQDRDTDLSYYAQRRGEERKLNGRLSRGGVPALGATVPWWGLVGDPDAPVGDGPSSLRAKGVEHGVTG